MEKIYDSILVIVKKEGKMELNINNEIINKRQTNDEITKFINELNAELKKDKKIETNCTLYNEIMEKVELAPKYQKELQNTIDKCLVDLSYEKDFYYFDYDMKSKKYFLDCFVQ